MQYELVDAAQQRQMLTDQLRASEAQHWNEVLRKIANPSDRAIQSQAADNLAKLEAGIVALRAELARFETDTVERPKLAETAVEAPAPASTVSAVHGDLSASEPGTDAPAS
jgi:hypothetical protein